MWSGSLNVAHMANLQIFNPTFSDFAEAHPHLWGSFLVELIFFVIGGHEYQNSPRLSTPLDIQIPPDLRWKSRISDFKPFPGTSWKIPPGGIRKPPRSCPIPSRFSGSRSPGQPNQDCQRIWIWYHQLLEALKSQNQSCGRKSRLASFLTGRRNEKRSQVVDFFCEKCVEMGGVKTRLSAKRVC